MANGLMNQGIVTVSGVIEGALSTKSSFAPDKSNKTSEFYDTSLLGNGIEDMSETEISAIPNQIKSLFLPSNGSVHSSFTGGGIEQSPDNIPFLSALAAKVMYIQQQCGLRMAS